MRRWRRRSWNVARKRELANKLTGQGEEQATRPGWRDTITGPPREDTGSGQSAERNEGRRETVRGEAARLAREREEEEARQAARRQRSNPLMRKTYLLTPELVDHVADLAQTERVGINELVRFLLRSSLDLVENGELEIPTRPARRQIVRGE